MLANLSKVTVRYLLCLIPVPLAAVITWYVAELNGQILDDAMRYATSEPGYPIAGPFLCMFICFAVPQLAMLFFASNYAKNAKSLWAHYSILCLNFPFSFLMNSYLTTPYDEASGVPAPVVRAIDQNCYLSWAIILAVYVLTALLLPRIPKAETNQSQPNPVR